MTIWKYVVPLVDGGEVKEIPRGYVPLQVSEQANLLCLWVLVDPDAPRDRIRLFARGTGQPFDAAEIAVYLGTGIMHGGRLVWHVFSDPVIDED